MYHLLRSSYATYKFESFFFNSIESNNEVEKIQVAANDLMHVFQPSCLNGESVEFLTLEFSEGANNLRATLDCKHGVKKQYNVAVREGLKKI